MRAALTIISALFILGIIGGVEHGENLENLLLIIPAALVIVAANRKKNGGKKNDKLERYF